MARRNPTFSQAYRFYEEHGYKETLDYLGRTVFLTKSESHRRIFRTSKYTVGDKIREYLHYIHAMEEVQRLTKRVPEK